MGKCKRLPEDSKITKNVLYDEDLKQTASKNPRYDNELFLFSKETIDNIQKFSEARTNFLNSKIEYKTTTQNDKENVANVELYRGRCAILRRIGFKTTLLRNHFKTLRPIKYYTLRRHIPDQDIIEPDETEDEIYYANLETYSKNLKYKIQQLFKKKSKKCIRQGYRGKISKNRRICTDEEEEKMKKKEKAKEKEKEKEKDKEKYRKQTTKKSTLERFKDANKLAAKSNIPCRCDNNKEVTFIIKGLCLCDRENINKFKSTETCKGYCKSKMEKAHSKNKEKKDDKDEKNSNETDDKKNDDQKDNDKKNDDQNDYDKKDYSLTNENPTNSSPKDDDRKVFYPKGKSLDEVHPADSLEIHKKRLEKVSQKNLQNGKDDDHIKEDAKSKKLVSFGPTPNLSEEPKVLQNVVIGKHEMAIVEDLKVSDKKEMTSEEKKKYKDENIKENREEEIKKDSNDEIRENKEGNANKDPIILTEKERLQNKEEAFREDKKEMKKHELHWEDLKEKQKSDEKKEMRDTKVENKREYRRDDKRESTRNISKDGIRDSRKDIAKDESRISKIKDGRDISRESRTEDSRDSSLESRRGSSKDRSIESGTEGSRDKNKEIRKEDTVEGRKSRRKDDNDENKEIKKDDKDENKEIRKDDKDENREIRKEDNKVENKENKEEVKKEQERRDGKKEFKKEQDEDNKKENKRIDKKIYDSIDKKLEKIREVKRELKKEVTSSLKKDESSLIVLFKNKSSIKSEMALTNEEYQVLKNNTEKNAAQQGEKQIKKNKEKPN